MFSSKPADETRAERAAQSEAVDGRYRRQPGRSARRELNAMHVKLTFRQIRPAGWPAASSNTEIADNLTLRDVREAEEL